MSMVCTYYTARAVTWGAAKRTPTVADGIFVALWTLTRSTNRPWLPLRKPQPGHHPLQLMLQRRQVQRLPVALQVPGVAGRPTVAQQLGQQHLALEQVGARGSAAVPAWQP